VLFAVYLALLHYSPVEIGLLFTAAIAGSSALTLASSAFADRIGRRRTALAMAVLMIVGGLLFVLTTAFPFLLIAALIGMSPSVSDVGVIQVLEHAVLPQTVPDRHRTSVFVVYNLLANLAAALGSLSAGAVVWLTSVTGDPMAAYRVFFAVFALIGAVNLLVYMSLSDRVELDRAKESLATHRPQRRPSTTILRLAAIQGLDAFAGGFALQSLVAYWFVLRWGFTPTSLGALFFGTNVLSGLALLSAIWLARRFGLLNVVVFSHLPASVLLLLVPLAPTAQWCVAVYLIRMSISQMDVPTRQSYAMAVVSREERVTAAGLMNASRSIGGAISPTLTGLAFAASALSLPFFVAGGLKIATQILFYTLFRNLRPPEERVRLEGASVATDTSLDLPLDR
jgi:MFS family permease